MKQSKLSSMMESVVDTSIGFTYAFALQSLLVWAYNVEMSNGTIGWFVFWFTVASFVRKYAIRRLWNAEWWKHPVTQRWRSNKWLSTLLKTTRS